MTGVFMKIAIFVDGANFYFMQRKELKWMVDLKKLIAYFDQMGTVVDAYYYTGIKYPITQKQHMFYTGIPDFGFALSIVSPSSSISFTGFEIKA
jgi:uncharacterized LabA/DUF88 family protein